MGLSSRPLAISCFEDKIVQEGVRRILERIYEPLFLRDSHGFRPGKGSDSALIALNEHLRGCGAVLEIDIQKYFNTIPHEPLIRLLKLKIADRRFLYLIIKLLKAPILTTDGKQERNEVGSPQGSILSPLIANIYLHYVMDIWFQWFKDKRRWKRASMVRYADDAVFTFRYLSEAEEFRNQLNERLNRFGISLHEDKTKAIVFGRREAERHERLGLRMPTFTFLGFLHVWGKSWDRRQGIAFWRVKRRTCPKRFRKKLAEIREYIRRHRHEKGMLKRIIRVVHGYLNYFAINDNTRRVTQFLEEVKNMLFKYMNRRSQRASFTWAKFGKILKRVKFPTAALRKNLFFASRSQ